MRVVKPSPITRGTSLHASYSTRLFTSTTTYSQRLCALQAKGVDGVFEQQGARRRSTDFRRGQRLGQRDHLIELQKPKIKPAWMSQTEYDQSPDTLQLWIAWRQNGTSICQIQKDGDVMKLEPKIISLLSCLATHQGEVVSREELENPVLAGTIVG